MTRSGIKRGLAVTAISALAITGVPSLATSAHAVPLADQVPDNTIQMLSQGGDSFPRTISLGSDGTNSTVSLVATADTNVTTALFQYSTDGGATWTDINSAVSRNAHGAFTTEWDMPAAVDPGDTVQLRVNGTGGVSDTIDVGIEADSPTNPSIELATEGDLGIYQNPITNTHNVAVSGTTSDPVTGSVNVFDLTEAVDGDPNYGHVNGLDSVRGSDGVSRFSGVLTYPAGPTGYNYSTGTAPDQVALTAGVDNAEDTEASTYYVQQVASVTGDAARNPVPVGGTTNVTVTVLDSQGKPVAGATVGYLSPDGGDAGTAPDDNPGVGTTNARGQVTITGLGTGSYTPYVDEGTAGYQARSDIEGQAVTITDFVAANSDLSVTSIAGHADFDVDELDGGAADFVATLTDQNGGPRAAQPIQYRYVFDDGPGAPVEGPWTNAGNTDANGKVTIPFTGGQAAGHYTLQVRRPNTGGTGLLTGDPFEFNAGEAEIIWAEGQSANSPVNDSDTYAGTLRLSNAGGATLEDREVTVDLNRTVGPGAVSFSASQPAGTNRGGDTTVTATTAADGGFSVSLTDPDAPPLTNPTPETVTLEADAMALSETPDTPAADAQADLVVKFQEQPEVGRIDVSVSEVQGLGALAPGKPAVIDVDVFGDDNDDNPANDPRLEDQSVTVSVDKGFLSPYDDANGDGDIDVNELVLDEDQDAQGDLFGFYDELGQSRELQTDDGATSPGDAQIVAAIERDAGFDDDGIVQMQITVKSGDVTRTETVTFDSRAHLNIGSFELVRDPSAPRGRQVELDEHVDFNLFAKDQYGNLVGDQLAQISDDTPRAEVVTDVVLGRTATDFVNDNSGVRANSNQEVTQTLEARAQVNEATVGATGDAIVGNRMATDAAGPITWVTAKDGPGGRKDINPALKLRHIQKGRDRDRVIVRAKSAEGADVKLFRIVRASLPGPRRVLVRTGDLNAKGNAKWFFRDGNGFRGSRRFKAVVFPTADTKRGNTQIGRVR